MVYYFVRQLLPLPDPAPYLGRLLLRRQRRPCNCRGGDHLGPQRYAIFYILLQGGPLIVADIDYLSSPHANFETILSLLSSYFVAEDEDAFINWIRTTLESQEIRSAMVDWRRTWGELVTQGRHHDALL